MNMNLKAAKFLFHSLVDELKNKYTVFKDIDTRFILEDFFAKVQIFSMEEN